MLHRLCLSIWETCHWPEDWKIQEFVVLFKSGEPKLCSNYPTIALVSHTSKILPLIIVDRLKRKLESEQPEEQAAYRKGRGTRDPGGYSTLSWVRMCGPKFRPPPYNKTREDANLLPISKPFVS